MSVTVTHIQPADALPAQAHWWEGGRFIGLVSISLWVGIWRIAVSIF